MFVRNDLPGGTVAVVSIPAARQPVSTSDGKLLIRGERQQRAYYFAGSGYRKASKPVSVDTDQFEQILLQYVKDHGKITRREAADLCQISQRQATYLLNKLLEKGVLRLEGHGRGTKYVPPN